jgi:hypothetical protein
MHLYILKHTIDARATAEQDVVHQNIIFPADVTRSTEAVNSA